MRGAESAEVFVVVGLLHFRGYPIGLTTARQDQGQSNQIKPNQTCQGWGRVLKLDAAWGEKTCGGYPVELGQTQLNRMSQAPSSIGPEPLLNRELSWLEFNQRVLEEALDLSTPLLERVKFFCIFSANLDEFFETRVAGLKQQSESSAAERSPDGLTATES